MGVCANIFWSLSCNLVLWKTKQSFLVILLCFLIPVRAKKQNKTKQKQKQKQKTKKQKQKTKNKKQQQQQQQKNNPNMVVASMITCKICLIWRHTKTRYLIWTQCSKLRYGVCYTCAYYMDILRHTRSYTWWYDTL